MRRYCEECKISYDDEFCSTSHPHKGFGFCIVCNCTICVCNKETARDWERSSNNKERK